MKFEKFNGKEMPESTREQWADEIEHFFRMNPEEEKTFIRSGDSLVFGINYDGYVTIMDCKIQRINYSWNSE